MPRVSVIVPVFNGEKFIRSALESVLSQTHADFEIIVVDDGSTDQSREVISGLKGPIECLHQENSGVAVARNHGFLHSRGELIAFLDQDDRWYPNKLEVQVAILDRESNLGIIYSDVDIIGETGQVIEVQSLGNKEPLGFLRRFPEYPRPHPFPSTVLMRREIFSRAGMYDPVFKKNGHEDTELWFRIVKNGLGTFKFHPESLVQRRHHTLQGGRNSETMDENWIVCLNKLTALYENDANRLRQLKRMLARTYRNQGRCLYVNGERQKGKLYLKQSVKHDPWNWKNLLGYARTLV